MKGLVLAALLAASGPALAAETNEPPLVGFYAGAGGGVAIVDDDDSGFDGDDTSFKIIGGFRLDKYYGFELAYLDNGNAEDGGVQVSSTGFEASALGFYPFNDRVAVFGKLGLLSLDFDITGVSPRVEDADDSVIYGLGVLVNLPKSLAVRLEVQASEVQEADLWVATLSALYRFKI